MLFHCIAAAEHVGVVPAQAALALQRFTGSNAAWKCVCLWCRRAMPIYDDFAHHPSAIRTTVEGLRRKVGAQRILAVFEPRSNTMKFGRHESTTASEFGAKPTWRFAQRRSGLGRRAGACPHWLARHRVACDIPTLVQQGAPRAKGDHILYEQW